MLGFFLQPRLLRSRTWRSKQEDRTTSVRDAASACARLVVNSKSVPVIIYKVHRIILVEMSYVHDWQISSTKLFLLLYICIANKATYKY